MRHALPLIAVALVGCSSILGLDDFQDAPASGGQAGSGAAPSGGQAGSGAAPSGGAGGSVGGGGGPPGGGGGPTGAAEPCRSPRTNHARDSFANSRRLGPAAAPCENGQLWSMLSRTSPHGRGIVRGTSARARTCSAYGAPLRSRISKASTA